MFAPVIAQSLFISQWQSFVQKNDSVPFTGFLLGFQGKELFPFWSGWKLLLVAEVWCKLFAGTWSHVLGSE
jgi:hypothetical protein